MGFVKPLKGHSDVAKFLFVKTKPSQNQKAPFNSASIDLSIGSTETKYIKLNTKTPNLF